MSRSQSAFRTSNSFLDALPPRLFEWLVPQLELHTIKRHQTIASAGDDTRHVWFPIGSMISTVTQISDGSSIEVGLTGPEGFAPLQAAFGALTSRRETIVQIPGSALRLRAGTFVDAYRNDDEFRNSCTNYAEYSLSAAQQFSACNLLHPVEQRYARWVLMAADRVGSNGFGLTQEFAAQMLGIRRSTVTILALDLAKKGAVSYRRGRVALLDRGLLEATACGCYDAVNHDLQQLMGYGARWSRTPTALPLDT